MNWVKAKLAEVGKISAGGDRPKVFSDIKTEQCQVPIYSNGEENEGLYGFTDKAKRKGDSITISARGNVGTVFFRKQAYVPIVRLLSIEPDQEVIDARYLYYLLKVKSFLSTGAAQQQITVPNISNYEIEYILDLYTQKRISSILSAHDDLIEANSKQIILLEEAAQNLYKEWLVNLHFPGCESFPFEGKIPQGWKSCKVADCLDFYGNGGWGKESSTGKYSHAGKVIRGTDICDAKVGRYNGIPTRFHTDNDVAKKILKEGDIVFELSNGNINNIGRSLYIDKYILANCGNNTICASFCKLFRPKDMLHGMLLYLEIQDMQTSGRMMPYKKQGSNGINNFAFEDFLKHELLIPQEADWMDSIYTIMKQISILREEIYQVQSARDMLLPRLINGEFEL